MKILIDTNVILDVLCNRADFVEDAKKIFKLCEVNKVDGYISALSVPNIINVRRKEFDSEKTADILEKLSLVFQIADLKGSDMIKAAKVGFNDYGDVLQSVCALRIKADYIITRNIKDFAKSKVTAIKPSEFLERV